MRTTLQRALLEFRRKVNKSYRGRSCPIAVHCSDGVGRSGTYILIDMVLNRMSKVRKKYTSKVKIIKVLFRVDIIEIYF